MVIERPASEDEEYKVREQRSESYFNIPSEEKETFAHAYAERLKQQLIAQKVIPFDPLD